MHSKNKTYNKTYKNIIIILMLITRVNSIYSVTRAEYCFINNALAYKTTRSRIYTAKILLQTSCLIKALYVLYTLYYPNSDTEHSIGIAIMRWLGLYQSLSSAEICLSTLISLILLEYIHNHAQISLSLHAYNTFIARWHEHKKYITDRYLIDYYSQLYTLYTAGNNKQVIINKQIAQELIDKLLITLALVSSDT